MTKLYDVAIIGGGVIGSATLFTLARYTNIEKIAFIEKYSVPGQVDSRATSNSQTLHYGDIETNFSKEKAKYVKESADMILKYTDKFLDKRYGIIRQVPKMVLGVGDNQVKYLEMRYEKIKSNYPNLRKLYKKDLLQVEPNLVIGREKNVNLISLYNPKGYMVNYGKLSNSFIENAKREKKQVDTFFNTKVSKIIKIKNGYKIISDNKIIYAKSIIVDSGAFSLEFAKQLGYGKNYALLAIAGNFYFTPKYLKSKVYTVQHPELPLAAVHGDPDILNDKVNRFGPTTIVVFMLERHKFKTIFDYLRSFDFDFATTASLIKILSNKTILKYVLTNNLLYNLPFIGNYFYVKEARKVIPALKASELEKVKGRGGIKPQVINTKERKLKMGAAKIIGNRAIFNITPSPGASSCMIYAYNDSKRIIIHLGGGYRFYENKFKNELK